MNSSQCLDVSGKNRFWSVYKFGRTAAIFKIANCPLLYTATISLSHLLRGHWSDFFKTCLKCLPIASSQVVSARKWFRSIDKYSRRQPSLIFTVIASPLKPLEEFSRNLAYEFLSMSRCVRPKMSTNMAKMADIFKIVNYPLLNTVTISLTHLLRDHWPDVLKTFQPPPSNTLVHRDIKVTDLH